MKLTGKKFQWLSLAAILTAFFLAGLSGLWAQKSQFVEESAARKVKTKVMPTYPQLAQKLHLSGKVRLQLVVEPDGHVKTVKVLGGHPVLADAATEAVKAWKYVPASGTTTEEVVIDFRSPDDN